MKQYIRYIAGALMVITALLGSVMEIKPMMNLFIAFVVFITLINTMASVSLNNLVKNYPIEARNLAQIARSRWTNTIDLFVAAMLAIGGSWVMFAVWTVLWMWSFGIYRSILEKLPKEKTQ